MNDTSADIQMQVQEKRGDTMEVGGIEDLPKLFILSAENLWMNSMATAKI